MSGPAAELDHPGLLPAMLVPHPDADPDASRLRRTTRDWIVDVLCFAFAVLLGAIAFAADASRDEVSDTVLAIDALLGVPACLAVWLRRRWPLGFALAMVPVGTISSAAGGAAVIAAFTLAVHRRFSIVAPVMLLSLALTPVFIALHPDESTPGWVQFVVVALITVAVVAWGMFVRARRQLVLSLRDRALRAEAEQQLRVDQARAAERTRIAREMHDVLAHRISLLSLHAGALEFRGGAAPEEVARAAGVMRATAHQALQDLREVIGVLREGADGDAPERPQPTLADLPALIEESRAAGVSVSSDCRVDDAVPDGVARSAYRIVQEGLTNARKHARGAAVAVAVTGARGAGVTVEVRNRLPVGRPGEADIPGSGTGLVGLSERVALAGGRLEHGRTEDGDFRLWAWLPWPA